MNPIFEIQIRCLKYLKKKTDNANFGTKQLLCWRSPQVCMRIKQYKDELLAACLTFVLSLHPDMVALDIKAYIPALQVRTK